MAIKRIVPREKDLSRYVSQVMRAKGLSPRDVAVRSGGQITSGYVMGLMKGIARNPSVDKLAALANGLDVDVHELFDAACQPTLQGNRRQQGNDTLRSLELLDLARRLAVCPPALISSLKTIADGAMILSPDELEAVARSVERLVEAKGSEHCKTRRR
jgi:transcriptional regulator with XRE-family HTH domain